MVFKGKPKEANHFGAPFGETLRVGSLLGPGSRLDDGTPFGWVSR